jgi:hypothetical protein
MSVVELGDYIIEFVRLAGDGRNFKFRFGLCEPKCGSVGPERWQPYSRSV